MIHRINAKTILSSVKSAGEDPFGISYNMNVYRGCTHACIYCDSRSSCYAIENFSDIIIKENAVELLNKELLRKKIKGVIGTGSMNDPYMPIEKELGLVRSCLEVIKKRKFPVHIITKSDLVLRDIDLLKEISKTYATVSITITSADESITKLIEPAASSSYERFAAVKALSDAGINAGVIITPILPFITDTKENLIALLDLAKSNKAKYVMFWPGMTCRTGQREYFYDKLDKYFPGIKEKYVKTFGDNYECPSQNWNELNRLYYQICNENKIPTTLTKYVFKDEELRLF